MNGSCQGINATSLILVYSYQGRELVGEKVIGKGAAFQFLSLNLEDKILLEGEE